MKHFRRLSIFLLLTSLWIVLAQTPNKRLILKDGSYQVVTKYEVKGDRVRYISAERSGDWEELPANLVDWAATEKWAKDHGPGALGPVMIAPTGPSPGSQEAAEIDKEEREQRADEIARMPTIAPGLRLPDEDGVFILDTFRGSPN